MLRLPILFALTLWAFSTLLGAGAAATGRYPNLFKEYLGKSDAEVAARLEGAWRQLFAGDPNSEALYYPVPGDMAYVPDINNHDVRSEGLSYGMMIAVQMDRKEHFDQIWRYAKHYMHHQGGPLSGYFAWHTAYDGRRLSAGPAPDGEEWFVMALFFASHRWGDAQGTDNILNYSRQAQELLRVMLHKDDEPDRGRITSMFNRQHRQIVFTPHPPGSGFTDPSYHLPAFSELWARWAADPADRAFLREVTQASRELFRKAAHPQTGLMPDYSNFDGTPHTMPWGNHDDFRYDAWRTLANPALDWSWWRADPWQVEQSNRVLRFLARFGENLPDCFEIDGTPTPDSYNRPGLIAMAAVAALAADREIGQPWVQRLWDTPLPTGRGRYYDGLLTMLGLLQVSGNYRIYGPVQPRN